MQKWALVSQDWHVGFSTTMFARSDTAATTVNWEIFAVKIFSSTRRATKIKRAKNSNAYMHYIAEPWTFLTRKFKRRIIRKAKIFSDLRYLFRRAILCGFYSCAVANWEWSFIKLSVIGKNFWLCEFTCWLPFVPQKNANLSYLSCILSAGFDIAIRDMGLVHVRMCYSNISHS